MQIIHHTSYLNMAYKSSMSQIVILCEENSTLEYSKKNVALLQSLHLCGLQILKASNCWVEFQNRIQVFSLQTKMLIQNFTTHLTFKWPMYLQSYKLSGCLQCYKLSCFVKKIQLLSTQSKCCFVWLIEDPQSFKLSG